MEVMPEDVGDIANGFMLALEEDFDLSECSEMPDIEELLVSAMSNLKLRTFSSVKDALTQLGTAVKQIIPAIKSCVCEHTTESMNEFAEVLIEPYSFAFIQGRDMVVNGRSIGREIKAAMVNFYMQEWNGFGYYLGKAMLNLA